MNNFLLIGNNNYFKYIVMFYSGIIKNKKKFSRKCNNFAELLNECVLIFLNLPSLSSSW